MSPYELRERLIKEVPEVKIYPILTKFSYSEEEYLEELKNQLALKHDIEAGNMITRPLYTLQEKELKMDKFYEKGWYKPKLFTLPKSMFRSED
ncbi:hypothetical protein [Enterococcus avium]|uniref:hypothetical protein n=1 Tax=Enterococcus avium TaxID=33945 RepID=UPI003D6A5746